MKKEERERLTKEFCDVYLEIKDEKIKDCDDYQRVVIDNDGIFDYFQSFEVNKMYFDKMYSMPFEKTAFIFKSPTDAIFFNRNTHTESLRSTTMSAFVTQASPDELEIKVLQHSKNKIMQDCCVNVSFDREKNDFHMSIYDMNYLENSAPKIGDNIHIGKAYTANSEKAFREMGRQTVASISFFMEKIENKDLKIGKLTNKMRVKNKKIQSYKSMSFVNIATSEYLSNNKGTDGFAYSNGFWVRGHWRKFNGIGKDRSGNRTVNNYTWVKEHTRLDELGILDKYKIA